MKKWSTAVDSPATWRGEGKGSEKSLTDDHLHARQLNNRRTKNIVILVEAQISMAVEGRYVNDVAFRHGVLLPRVMGNAPCDFL